MEHIVQFSFSVDDDAIEKKLEDQAVGKLLERFDAAVVKAAHRRMYSSLSSQSFEDTVRDLLEKRIDKYIDEHGQAIVDVAGKMLAEKLARSKKGKALLEEKEE